ncbi:MAG: globin [Paludibacter sp.]
MELIITEYQKGERPAVTIPNPEFLAHLGEDGIRKMVSRHYDLMRQSEIKHLFPSSDDDFEKAKLRSSDFMIQICGGNDYFNQNRGKPMMINRHSPFKITVAGRKVWLECYRQALLETNLPEALIRSFWNYINVFSSWMVNS